MLMELMIKRGIGLDKNDTKYLVKVIGENGWILTKTYRMRIAMYYGWK